MILCLYFLIKSVEQFFVDREGLSRVAKISAVKSVIDTISLQEPKYLEILRARRNFTKSFKPHRF